MNITKADIMAILKEDQAFSDVTTNSIIVQNKLQKPCKVAPRRGATLQV